MREEYKHLMDQQFFSSERSLFDKLARSEPQRKTSSFRKVLIAACCLCLLIPTAVFAAEAVFDLAILKIYPRSDLKGNEVIGYDIDFETTKELPLSAFSEKWQTATVGETAVFDSLEAAEADLGIDLLDNPVLQDEYLAYRSFRTEATTGVKRPVPCYMNCRVFEGQLWSFSVFASYVHKDSAVYLTAEALVEHPNIPEDVKEVFTAVQYLLDDDSDLDKISTEEYVTANGLPVYIITHKYEDFDSYTAVFRVDGIRYMIETGFDEKGYDSLIRILEAYSF